MTQFFSKTLICCVLVQLLPCMLIRDPSSCVTYAWIFGLKHTLNAANIFTNTDFLLSNSVQDLYVMYMYIMYMYMYIISMVTHRFRWLIFQSNQFNFVTFVPMDIIFLIYFLCTETIRFILYDVQVQRFPEIFQTI